MNKMNKIYVTYSSCMESRVEASLYWEYFEKNGYERTNKIEEADVLLFLTCGFSGTREEESIKKIEMLKKNCKKIKHLAAILKFINPG